MQWHGFQTIRMDCGVLRLSVINNKDGACMSTGGKFTLMQSPPLLHVTLIFPHLTLLSAWPLVFATSRRT